MSDKYEVVVKGANNAKGEPCKVGEVLNLDKVPSYLVGKVRKVSDAVTSEDAGPEIQKLKDSVKKLISEQKENAEKVEELKAENEALKAENESLKKSPELELEPATPPKKK